jgi:hypothetical protein
LLYSNTNRDAKDLDTTQLKALQEFLPTEDELCGLKAYLKQHSSSDEVKKQAYDGFCACEKYMVAMMDVQDAHAKFDCIIFRSRFNGRKEEIVSDIKSFIKACDELKQSLRLRKTMGIILNIGNQINTGGEGTLAKGFTLDALLKLNEVSFLCFKFRII